jgi:hypothetical protein
MVVGYLGFQPRLALSQVAVMRLFVRRIGEAAMLDGVECGPCPDFALYPGICLTT